MRTDQEESLGHDNRIPALTIKDAIEAMFRKECDLEHRLAEVTKQQDMLYKSLSIVWKHLRGERIRHDYVTPDNQTLQQVVKAALAAVKGEQHE